MNKLGKYSSSRVMVNCLMNAPSGCTCDDCMKRHLSDKTNLPFKFEKTFREAFIDFSFQLYGHFCYEF